MALSSRAVTLTAQIGEIAMTYIRQMVLTRRKARGEDPEAGFTLIELLVVLLIIAILLAIAVPTFLSARTSAENRAAQTNVRNALVDLQAFYVHAASFSGLTASGLQSSDPALQWTTGTTTSTSKVIVNLNPGSSATGAPTPVDQSVFITAKSAAGECYQALLVESSDSTVITASSTTLPNASGTWYVKYAPTSSGDCSPGLILSNATGWSQSTSVGW